MSATEPSVGALFARGRVATEVSERAFVRALVDVEVALLHAVVRAGLAPPSAVDALPSAAELAASLDLDALRQSTIAHGTPIPGLLAELRRRLGKDAAAALHRGATSQDIVDTAIMLVARRALDPLLEDLQSAAAGAAALAAEHRATPQVARTLLQQAAPSTFGLQAAVWLVSIEEAVKGLRELSSGVLAVQLGGAVGNLAALGARGPEVVADVAAQLGLAAPEIPWHAIRARPARLASALAIALGTMAKPARDVVLLSQTEVGELRERAGGGSSAMPHKHNPVGSVAVLACSHRAPGLLATVVSAMAPELQRAAGAWQAEWEPLMELLRLAGAGADALRGVIAGLEVDAERMRENLAPFARAVDSGQIGTAFSLEDGVAASAALVDRLLVARRRLQRLEG